MAECQVVKSHVKEGIEKGSTSAIFQKIIAKCIKSSIPVPDSNMILRQVFLMKKDLLILVDFQRPVLKCEALRSVFDAHLARQDLRKARLVAAEALRHFREQNNKKAQACRSTFRAVGGWGYTVVLRRKRDVGVYWGDEAETGRTFQKG